MKRLKHPNIIKYEALYIDMRKRVGWLVMELVAWPSLQKAHLSQQNSIKTVMVQLLETLSYMHRQDIVHRDIKPENILIDLNTNKIKIIDFGISKRLRRRGDVIDMWTITGALYYRAPQMFRGDYSESIDVWAAGILLYWLVTGYTPFESEYQQKTIENILTAEPQFTEKFNFFSHDFKDLVSKMLSKEPDSRPSTYDCLKHVCFLSSILNRNTSDKRQTDLSKYEQSTKHLANRIKFCGVGKNKSLNRDLEEFMKMSEQKRVSLGMVRPYVQMMNGRQYFCIDSEWQRH